VSTVEWGYRLDDDPYVVQMSGEESARAIAADDPNVTVVRRVISDWEPVLCDAVTDR
jgi:hypothetical protein